MTVNYSSLDSGYERIDKQGKSKGKYKKFSFYFKIEQYNYILRLSEKERRERIK